MSEQFKPLTGAELKQVRAEIPPCEVEGMRLLATIDHLDAQLNRAAYERDRNAKERDQSEGVRQKLAIGALAALSAAGIATPEAGYSQEPQSLEGDISRLAQERDELKEDMIEAYARLSYAAMIDRSVDCESCTAIGDYFDSAPAGHALEQLKARWVADGLKKAAEILHSKVHFENEERFAEIHAAILAEAQKGAQP